MSSFVLVGESCEKMCLRLSCMHSSSKWASKSMRNGFRPVFMKQHELVFFSFLQRVQIYSVLTPDIWPFLSSLFSILDTYYTDMKNFTCSGLFVCFLEYREIKTSRISNNKMKQTQCCYFRMKVVFYFIYLLFLLIFH